MTNPKDCSQMDFSKYDAMSTPELQQLLREDASKSEEEESDTAVVLYIMEVLAQRRRAQNQGKSPEEALVSFKWQYDTENFLNSEGRKKKLPIYAQPLWKRSLAAAMVLVILLVGGTATAQAFGVDMWKVVAVWTKDVFQFGHTSGGFPSVEGGSHYKGLEDAMDAAGMEGCKIPRWLPEGYEEESVHVLRDIQKRSVVARYERGEERILIQICVYIVGAPLRIERDDTYMEIYTVNGVDYYLFNNVDRLCAAWLVGSYEYYMSGPLTLDEMKKMIDSVA